MILAAFIIAVSALGLNAMSWFVIGRTRYALRSTRLKHDATEALASSVLAKLNDVRRAALEEVASAVAGSLANDGDPEFNAGLLYAERLIHALIKETTR